MNTSKPPSTSPKVGTAPFGEPVFTTRGAPLHDGAVHVPMLVAKGTMRPGTGTRPLVAPKAITGTSIAAACVRFSMSGRPRPTDSCVESRLIACEHCPSLVQEAPTLPATHVPVTQSPPLDVTLNPALG